jgi:predicted DNA-binding transcriptional regulator YafY
MRSKTKQPTPRIHLEAYFRLQKLTAEIQRGRYPNKDDLARVIERTPRTVQRDLRALEEEFKAPLAFDRVRNGFYFTDPEWRMPRVQLTEGELISFFAAERFMRRLGAATAEIRLARDAVRSLAALLPNEVHIDLGALEDAISFAPEPGLDAAPAILRKLADAAVHRHTLEIRYRSQTGSGVTERHVDVLLLHNHLGEWYAVCHDHLSGELRDFHAGRILEAANTRRPFTPPATWNADEYLRRGFGMFRGGAPVTVEIEFDEHQARYARERKYHATEKQHELPGGRLRLTFDVTEAALEQVARWLMQFGEHAQAVQPPQLRTLLHERLTRAAALYTTSMNEPGAKQ